MAVEKSKRHETVRNYCNCHANDLIKRAENPLSVIFRISLTYQFISHLHSYDPCGRLPCLQATCDVSHMKCLQKILHSEICGFSFFVS